MALADLSDWMTEYGRPGYVWYAKRLSANDTLANESHQYGPYIPKDLLFSVFPSIARTDIKNPDAWFKLYIDSHADVRDIRAIYYNNKFHDNPASGRNEARLTNFGGSSSALLDPDSTGALAIFAFNSHDRENATECHVWVCRHATEEDLLEERLGPVEPKTYVTWIPGVDIQANLFIETKSPRLDCCLEPTELPQGWLDHFPTGEEIIKKTLELRPPNGMDPDERLLRRRRCEYEVFKSVEKAIFLPRIKKGIESIESFVSLAQTILQSRKSRSGNSLELHIREIMTEEGLQKEKNFSHRPVIEGGKRPDFLFPSKKTYEDNNFPAKQLRMLAAKTTCKDRWRQVINEASRIETKHLLTLQEGVSEGQFREMQEAGVKLVVPTGLHDAYPKTVRPYLITFESFIGDVRLLSL